MAALFGISLGSFQRYRAVIRNQADRQLAQAEIAQARVSIASNSLNTFITACDYYLADEAYYLIQPAARSYEEAERSFEFLYDDCFTKTQQAEVVAMQRQLERLSTFFTKNSTGQGQSERHDPNNHTINLFDATPETKTIDFNKDEPKAPPLKQDSTELSENHVIVNEVTFDEMTEQGEQDRSEAFFALSKRLVVQFQRFENLITTEYQTLEAKATVAASRDQLVFWVSVLLFLGALVGVLSWAQRQISVPISELASAARFSVSHHAHYEGFDRGSSEIRLLNGTLKELINSLEGMVESRTEQISNQAKTLESQAAELTQLIDTANAPIFGIDVEGRVNEWNQQSANITGFSKEEVIGRDLVADFITDDYKTSVENVLRNALQGSETANYEFPIFTKTKRQVDVLLNATTRRDTEGNITGVIGVGQNITELRKKDAALQQAQKMEAVGQLTGGIAHDFNNLLTVIIGNLVFLRDDTKPMDADTEEAVNDAIAAAQDGAELTQNLLRFSRKEELKPALTDISLSIEKFARFLSRTVGENIGLVTDSEFKRLQINIDPNQFENALLNLAINSRDAMPEGGTITISTHLHEQTAEDVLGTGLRAGTYARITIKDTGQGISPDHLPHIFEPFFTTKERERGTGLGLSMVYGFAQQSAGTCLIDESTPKGTSISLFFPYSDSDRLSLDASSEPPFHPHQDLEHCGVVLVVEDEPRVRKITTRNLQRLGYTVHEAETAEQARRFLESGDRIDLLLSDVLMPGDMDGFRLAEWTQQHYPETKILLLSGYASGHADKLKARSFQLIKKPYQYEVLAATLQSVLAGTPQQNDHDHGGNPAPRAG